MTIAAGAMVVIVAPGAASITGAADPTVTPIVLDGTVETAPIVSDDGTLLLLSSEVVPEPEPDPDPDPEAVVDPEDPAPTTLRLHDRTTGETIDLPDVTGEFAAMSGDGCTIAGVTPVSPAVDPPEFELRVIDRCGDDPTAPLTSAVIATTGVVGPLALDVDGDTIVVNTGAEIVRSTRTLATDTDPASEFTVADRFDIDPLSSDLWATLGRVDVSDDGTVVVFEAVEAVDPVPPEPPVSSVYVWDAGTVTLVAPDAEHPSVSGDGRLVTADVRSDVGPFGPGVVVVERSSADGTISAVTIDPEGDLPTISADGAHLLYVVPTGETPGLRRTTWVGDGVAPYVDVVTTDLSAPLDGEVRAGVPTTAAGASRLGDVIGSDDPTSGDVLVRVTPAAASFGAAEYDLGSGEVGVTLSGVATLTNDGASTIDLTAAVIAVGSPFSIVDPGTSPPCTGTVRPGASCTIGVEYVVPVAIDAVADLTVTLPGAESPLATTRFIAVGTTTTTTSSSTTTTSSTTSPPIATTPNTTRTTTRNTTSNTTRTTTRVTTRATTTTTTLPPAQPAFSPAAFDFAPTIVDAGRRVASISLANPSPTAAQVTAVRLEPDGAGFTVEPGSDCVGASLSAGSSCRIDLAFAPLVEGPTVASVIATLADGSQVTASITGLGAPPPVVDVVPGVASTGQVVTARGAGFPAGAVVDLTVGTEPRPRSVTISDVGGFDVPVVVLPNTMPGPLVVSVAGQVDLFPTVDTSFLITVTSDRTSPAVLRGVGPSIGR